MKERQRTHRVFAIRPCDIISLFSQCKKGGELRLPLIKGIPEDAEIDGAEFSFQHNAFLIRVWHESFKEIHPACAVPVEHLDWEIVRFRIGGDEEAVREELESGLQHNS